MASTLVLGLPSSKIKTFLFNVMGVQMNRIISLLFLHQRPGPHQQFRRQLHLYLRVYSLRILFGLKSGPLDTEGGILKIRLASLGNLRDRLIRILPTSVCTQNRIRPTSGSPLLKSIRISDRSPNLRRHIGTQSRDRQKKVVLRKLFTQILNGQRSGHRLLNTWRLCSFRGRDLHL
jgi:hypothetical protein